MPEGYIVLRSPARVQRRARPNAPYALGLRGQAVWASTTKRVGTIGATVALDLCDRSLIRASLPPEMIDH
jgi:hypothetical protein